MAVFQNKIMLLIFPILQICESIIACVQLYFLYLINVILLGWQFGDWCSLMKPRGAAREEEVISVTVSYHCPLVLTFCIQPIEQEVQEAASSVQACVSSLWWPEWDYFSANWLARQSSLLKPGKIAFGNFIFWPAYWLDLSCWNPKMRRTTFCCQANKLSNKPPSKASPFKDTGSRASRLGEVHCVLCLLDKLALEL